MKFICNICERELPLDQFGHLYQIYGETKYALHCKRCEDESIPIERISEVSPREFYLRMAKGEPRPIELTDLNKPYRTYEHKHTTL